VGASVYVCVCGVRERERESGERGRGRERETKRELVFRPERAADGCSHLPLARISSIFLGRYFCVF
jgi:hypothetical protein